MNDLRQVGELYNSICDAIEEKNKAIAAALKNSQGTKSLREEKKRLQ